MSFSDKLKNVLKAADDSKRYFIIVNYIDNNGNIQHYYQRVNFPLDDMPKSLGKILEAINKKEIIGENFI